MYSKWTKKENEKNKKYIMKIYGTIRVLIS